MSRPTPEAINEPFRGAAEQVRRCDCPGCPEAGLYRAPQGRDRLTDYYWFCLDHVRQYNLAWDYFRGMNEAEIEAIRRYDTVWQRPSWPFSGNYHAAEERLRNAYHHVGGENGQDYRPHSRPWRPQSPEEQALAVFDLHASASFTEVKARYKKLVKRLHPDANGGDREAEERLKVVNQAYHTLKKAFGQETPR
ncbi:MAG: J domain-containing protein [Kiloniellales bacterium]